MSEIYKSIPGYESHYEISNLGNVRGLVRGNLLKGEVTNKGYIRVSLSKEGKVIRHSVHRLVALTFLANTLGKSHINHIDNDPTNNNVTNLEWVTHSENMIHAHKQGRLANIAASNAAIEPNHYRYAETYKKRLGNRFIAYLPSKNVMNTARKGKCPSSAVSYICKSCDLIRTSLVAWAEIQKHNGLCPNCQMLVTVDEDIV